MFLIIIWVSGDVFSAQSTILSKTCFWYVRDKLAISDQNGLLYSHSLRVTPGTSSARDVDSRSGGSNEARLSTQAQSVIRLDVHRHLLVYRFDCKRRKGPL